MTRAGDFRSPAEQRRPFYATVADEADFGEALAVEGLDDEIALLRTRLRAHLDAHPQDLGLMLRSVTLIVRAVGARYRMNEKRASELAASLNIALDAVDGQLE